MQNRGSGIESGIGSEESGEGCSAVRNFFDDFVNKLGTAVQRGRGLEMEIDDPTIDLDRIDRGIMAICPPSPIQHNNSQSKSHNKPITKDIEKPRRSSDETFKVMENKDPSLGELRVIVSQLKDKSTYGEKLARIMLKGLEKTLTSGFYDLFVQHGLPENWCPIVKMNNDNTPFVEFLVKSDVSDQPPTSQMNDYTVEHMALCQYVVNHLHALATHNKPLSERLTKGSSRPQSQTLNHQQPKIAVNCKDKRSSLPAPMTCSTPIAQRRPSIKRNFITATSTTTADTLGDSLNESKRILPPRACKISSNRLYREL